MTDLFNSIGEATVELYDQLTDWSLVVRLGLAVTLVFVIAVTRRLSRSSKFEAVRDASAVLGGLGCVILAVLAVVFVVQGCIALLSLLPHLPTTGILHG